MTAPATSVPVCLTMIVKNEAHCIVRALESALPYITCYSICDTGSTDSTKEVIKEYMDSKNISGTIHDTAWKDFGTNRSIALQKSREQTGGKGWSFMLDADDSIHSDVKAEDLGVPPILAQLSEHKIHCMNIVVREGGSVYNRRPQFFNNEFPWCYKGVLHEYAYLEGEVKSANLPDVVYIMGRREGARNAIDPKKKYKRDAEILQKALEENPQEPRTRFYLAQSYRDADMKAKALRHYKVRAEMKQGWAQEAYMSCLNVMEMTEDIDDKIRWAIKGIAISPNRLEIPTYLIAYARRNSIWRQDIMAIACVPDDYTLSDNYLFAEPELYKWRYFDEMAVYASWTGHYKRSMEFGQKALEACTNEQDKHRLAANIEHAKSKLKI